MPEGLHLCNRGWHTHGRKKTGEITRSGDTCYKKALIQNICFKVAPLRVHASPCKTAGRGFATPGYKSVALRAIANKSAQ
jgi:hypothetical protein